MNLVYKYSRYDIAKNQLPKKKWWPLWLICYDCAKRVGITRSYESSNLRTLYDPDYPGCEACGKKDGLAEVRVSYEVCQKLRKIGQKVNKIKLEDVLKIREGLDEAL
jgi:hypothetical protein